MTQDHPTGATLHLGGDAWAMPSLEPLLVPIDTLVLYPGNPRRGDQEAITSSIRDHGLYAGVVTQTTTGHTLVGNHRLRSLLDLGATRAPSTPADVDDTRAAQIVARDNLTSDRGGYDDTEQLALLEALAAQDQLPGSGYTTDDLDALRAAAEPEPKREREEDVPLPQPGPPISQVGDLWELGHHRLLVGDATTRANNLRALDGATPDCVFTDPPYGIAYKTIRKGQRSIENDSTDDQAFFVTAAALEWVRGVGTWFVCCDWRSLPMVLDALNHNHVVPKACIVWDKQSRVQNLDRYAKQHEFVVYAGPYGGQPTQATDIWRHPRDFDPDHPTPKPVSLIEQALSTATEPGAVIYDPFAGSGSTLIACQQTGRIARLIELDPRYADVICRRYQQHTGTLPVRDGVQVDFTEVLAPVQDDGEVLAPTNRAE